MSKRSPAKMAMDRAFRVWKLCETATQAAWRQYHHAQTAFLGKEQARKERIAARQKLSDGKASDD